MHIKTPFFPRWSLFLRLPLLIMKSEFYMMKIITVDPIMLRYRSLAILKAKDRFYIFRWGHNKFFLALCWLSLWGSTPFKRQLIAKCSISASQFFFSVFLLLPQNVLLYLQNPLYIYIYEYKCIYIISSDLSP